jgi:hypothetical protein
MRLRTRAVVALGLLTALAWCLLLFGIGLDDLTDNNTKPGAILSIALLVILIPAFLYGIWRALRPIALRRFARH